ncbi:LacI family transcriptional regulator [Pacificimonas flava]|nr:LacI family transcriptional regulator [Pacificimonas flava]
MSKSAACKSANPTINDVAALAGVSKKTVSRVINRSPLLSDATRDKVETAIRKIGFVPNPQARALALRRNFLIVLLHDNPNAQTVLNFQTGVLQTIRDSDLALVVRPVDRDSADMLADVRTFLEKQRPLGVLLLPPISERGDLADLCRNAGVEYVRIGSAMLDDEAHCVASNDREVVSEACQALIERGHRRIGFVRGPSGFRSAQEREDGFRDTMAQAGIALNEEWIAQGNYRFSSGLVAGEQILKAAPRPTAILASNDEMAAGVMHAAKHLGIDVPSKLSIVGFDDSPTASHLWPPLSTVRWPIVEMGRVAARKLVARYLPDFDEGAGPLPTRLASTFIDRASMGSPSD